MYEAVGFAQKLHAQKPTVWTEPSLLEKIWGFLLGRLEVQLRDRGQPDSIEAVLHTGAHQLVSLEKRLVALQTVREKSRAQFEATAAAFKRIANILAQAAQKSLVPLRLPAAALRAPPQQALLS